MTAHDLFTYGWIAWLALFPIVEGAALYMDKTSPTGDANGNRVKDDGFTLSAHVRKWFRVDTAHGRTAFLVSLMVFAGTFLMHINSGAWLG